jgi:hypothetical protein
VRFLCNKASFILLYNPICTLLEFKPCSHKL